MLIALTETNRRDIHYCTFSRAMPKALPQYHHVHPRESSRPHRTNNSCPIPGKTPMVLAPASTSMLVVSRTYDECVEYLPPSPTGDKRLLIFHMYFPCKDMQQKSLLQGHTKTYLAGTRDDRSVIDVRPEAQVRYSKEEIPKTRHTPPRIRRHL